MLGQGIDTKVCTTCNKEKELRFFNKSKKGYLGRKSECKDCQSEYRKKHYSNNKEAAYLYNKNRRSMHKEEIKTYKRQHKKKRLAYYSALNAKRRSSKLQRTPKWADLEKIKAYYDVCAFFNEVNGYTKYHVDHIAPLQGKNVSGLHVHTNLQVIPAKENLTKGNKYNGI